MTRWLRADFKMRGYPPRGLPSGRIPSCSPGSEAISIILKWPLSCLLLVSAWMFQMPSWADESPVFVLEPSQVDISAGFNGTDLTAIGSMQGPGELIVKVAGPLQEVTLSRKAKLGPFWVEGETVKWEARRLLFSRHRADCFAAIAGRAAEIRIAPRRRAGAYRAATTGARGGLAQGIFPAKGETGLLPGRQRCNQGVRKRAIYRGHQAARRSSDRNLYGRNLARQVG